ncbi:hypothetical protein [Pedobacter steynii]|uniref:Uncharacterized protein n=1 Tax=Pedobacter steynii TaxID=430522 RepID=A0A1D7QMD7_9SPHI|nr:hypothetical protein [Pedobacter steynii]AOM79813.1 hypothetical protein BFS30_23205 [Pedobacter steynii]
MNQTQELGALKSKHNPGKGFTYFAIFTLILFTAISAMIYFEGILAVQEGRLRFSGDISILYWCIAFIMGLGIVILLTALKLSKGKTFYLYEKGILTEGNGAGKIQLFENLDDLYLFSSGRTFITNNIAFRNREEGNWEVITVRYTKVFKAIEFITTQHELLYVPKMQKELAENKPVTFQYISYDTALGKKLFATGTQSFLKVQPKEIILNKDHLIIDAKKIMIADLNHFSVNNWISQISLYNKENKVVFSTATNGIFSGRSFVSLMDKLINQTN